MYTCAIHTRHPAVLHIPSSDFSDELNADLLADLAAHDPCCLCDTADTDILVWMRHTMPYRWGIPVADAWVVPYALCEDCLNQRFVRHHVGTILLRCPQEDTRPAPEVN